MSSVKIVQEMKEVMEVLAVDAELWEDGNKSAGARVRKYTLELAKLGKDFRKESIAEAKAVDDK